MSASLPDPETVASLKEFYSVEEIREAWRSVTASLTSRAREKITIVSKSQDGHAASGIVLSDPAEKREFVKACRQALFEKDPDHYADPGYGRPRITDHSSRPVMF